MDLRSEFNFLLAVVFALFITVGRAAGFEEEWRLDGNTCYRGVAVLSSNIGERLTIDEVVEFAKTCKLNLVVIDYAWITHHWPRTDHSKVRRLVTRLQHDGVRVAAMYRPRAMNPSEANVHFAVTKNGEVPGHHNNLCLAHEDSVSWGASWGRKILEKLPEVHRIILYNLLPICACTECRGGNGRQHAAAFIDCCRSNWREIRPSIEIGHVGVGTEYADKVDFVCPFVSVNRDDQGKVKIQRAVSLIRAAKSRLKSRPAIPLVKLCWASKTANTTDDVIEAVTRCTRAKLGFIIWYYEWLFQSETEQYDRKTILKALGGDWNVMVPYYTRTDQGVKRRVKRNNPGGWVYFESRESREGCAPMLSLTFGKNTRRIPVSKDVPVMSYFPDRPYPIHPRLSIQLNDANRTLLYFDIPGKGRSAKLDRAELILDMKNSQVPVVAPFNLAIHAVTKSWDERTTAWQNQPSFMEDPAIVVSIKPQPGMLHLDVTKLVLAWMKGELPNNGFLLKASTPLENENQAFTELKLDGVAVAAVLRACGIPVQITYCPAGYIHGIIRFYLKGYGWCRMDATCGVGRLPLVQEKQHRGLVRLFDMPIEMESIENAYAWPYQHNTQHGKYVFLSDDRVLSNVRFAARDEAEARKAGRITGRVKDPFPHLEPGSWNKVLDLREWDLSDAEWADLVTASHDAVVAKEFGVLGGVVEALDGRLMEDQLTDLILHLGEYGTLPE